MKHTVIADTGEYLIKLLQRDCVPSPVKSADRIGLCALDDFGDFSLCLSLYDIQFMDRGLFNPSLNIAPLCLRYVLTAHSQSPIEVKAMEEHKIIGRAVSVLAKNCVISKENGFLGETDLSISVIPENLSVDEKNRILSNVGRAAKAAVFYCVSPVMIDIDGDAAAARVRSTV